MELSEIELKSELFKLLVESRKTTSQSAIISPTTTTKPIINSCLLLLTIALATIESTATNVNNLPNEVVYGFGFERFLIARLGLRSDDCPGRSYHCANVQLRISCVEEETP